MMEDEDRMPPLEPIPILVARSNRRRSNRRRSNRRRSNRRRQKIQRVKGNALKPYRKWNNCMKGPKKVNWR